MVWTDTKKIFSECIEDFATYVREPLIILLDSLDQLSAIYQARALAWLPEKLPQGVKLVVSTLPELYDILKTLQSRLSPENLLVVPPVGESDSLSILQQWLSRDNRTLTKEQEEAVLDSIEGEVMPLYLQLIYDQIWKWRSYEEPEKIPHDMKSCIIRLYDSLEADHGSVLVKRSLGYLAASKAGLSEGEMEDLLSLDDEVYK